MKLLVILRNIALFVLPVLLVSGCKEKVEGCLDLEASNFNFSADLPCPDDCCTYPTMSFEIAFRWDSLTFRYNDPYPLANGKVMKITKSKFYISDISLTNSTDTYRVRDEIVLFLNDNIPGAVTFVDDFVLMSRDFASFVYEIGEIRGSGQFDTLRFSVGLNELANKTDPASAPVGHPLAIQADTMWSVENNYFFHKMILIPDTIPPLDTLEFRVAGYMNLVEVAIPFQVDIGLGKDVVLPLVVDYKLWLEGIDFETDPPETVIGKIVQNTAQAFSINQ